MMDASWIVEDRKSGVVWNYVMYYRVLLFTRFVSHVTELFRVCFRLISPIPSRHIPYTLHFFCLLSLWAMDVKDLETLLRKPDHTEEECSKILR